MIDTFKYIPLERIEYLGSPLVCMLCEEQIQNFAEDNCGGPLTEEELRDLPFAFQEAWDCDYMFDAISKLRPRLRTDHIAMQEEYEMSLECK